MDKEKSNMSNILTWLIVGFLLGGLALGTTVFKEVNEVTIIQEVEKEVEKIVTVTEIVEVPARSFNFTHGTQTIEVTEPYVVNLLEAKSDSNNALNDLFKESLRDMADEFDDIDKCGNRTYDDDDMRMVGYSKRQYEQRERDDDDEYKVIYHNAEIEYDDHSDECERIFDTITIRYDDGDVDVDFDN